MEHDNVRRIIADAGLKRINGKNLSQLIKYAEILKNFSGNFNLTAELNFVKIAHNLIVESIKPFAELNVPRGTSFLDMGSGAGIPGIPLALYNEKFSGSLVDSNNKKIYFLKKVVRDLHIKNLRVLKSRVEDLGRSDHREKYNYVLSRAFNHIYVTLELASSMVKYNGFVYIYMDRSNFKFDNRILNHSRSLGLEIISPDKYNQHQISGTGLLCKKINILSDIYPRNFSVLKRESRKDEPEF